MDHLSFKRLFTLSQIEAEGEIGYDEDAKSASYRAEKKSKPCFTCGVHRSRRSANSLSTDYLCSPSILCLPLQKRAGFIRYGNSSGRAIMLRKASVSALHLSGIRQRVVSGRSGTSTQARSCQ